MKLENMAWAGLLLLLLALVLSVAEKHNPESFHWAHLSQPETAEQLLNWNETDCTRCLAHRLELSYALGGVPVRVKQVTFGSLMALERADSGQQALPTPATVLSLFVAKWLSAFATLGLVAVFGWVIVGLLKR